MKVSWASSVNSRKLFNCETICLYLIFRMFSPVLRNSLFVFTYIIYEIFLKIWIPIFANLPKINFPEFTLWKLFLCFEITTFGASVYEARKILCQKSRLKDLYINVCMKFLVIYNCWNCLNIHMELYRNRKFVEIEK